MSGQEPGHGTITGAARHRDLDEPLCPPCARAEQLSTLEAERRHVNPELSRRREALGHA